MKKLLGLTQKKRRIAAVVALLVVSCALLPQAGYADSGLVVHDRFVDETLWVNDSTCAFPINVSGSSNVDDLVFLDESGELARLLETVSHAVITFSANGKSLEAKGSGGIEYLYNPDGTITVHTFGINLMMTIPQYGAIFLDAGRATY